MPDTLAGFAPMNGRRQVLVAAGEPESRQRLSGMLANGYEVISVATGASVLEQLYANKDSMGLVLLELPLPDMQGIDIIRQVNEDPQLMRIPVVALADDKAMEAELLNGGAMDFIAASDLRPDALLARVRHAIELSENRYIIRFAERDQLTGLYNKEFFFSYAEQYDAYHKDLAMDAILVNVSHFHMINERYGKAYGDDVLRRIGGRIADHVHPDGGIVCRREGDTFLIYCPHRQDYDKILQNACSGMDSRVHLRMGVYPNVDKALDMDQRFDRAKLASDTVRNSYTRTVAIYDDKLHKNEIYTEQLLLDFPKAIEEKQFVVYYQPKFEIQPTMPVLNSAEALVRWKHPKLGMISPGDFIPLFESNGLIRTLDSYVWRTVAAQMRDWKDRIGFCVPVSVNVSRVDIFDYDLVDHMRRLVQEFDLSPDEFLLEITESAYTQDSAQIIETVKRLRDAGFHIEVDDFGSGYSSLNMIASLPMDALKLDMEFMRNAFKERKNTKMLDAVIDIAYSLEVPTIAEGVETAEQMFALKEMGCDIVQGYYFSRPVPAEEYERFLVERKQMLDGTADHDRELKVKPAEQFAYEALHDPQTGLYNHSAYKMLLKDADQRNIALLIANLDDYDAILRENGQSAADECVQLVASVLHHSFRSVDFVCRIGVDEFAVIMTRVNSGMKGLISEKVDRINALIRENGRELPPITLSLGVAFADRENPQGDIFHDADVALSRMKAMKQHGWAIF